MEVCLDEIDMLLLKGYCVANEVEMLGAAQASTRAAPAPFPQSVHHGSSRKGVGLFRRHPTLL